MTVLRSTCTQRVRDTPGLDLAGVPIECHPLGGQGVDHSSRLGPELIPLKVHASLAVVPAMPVGQREDADSDGFVSRHALTVSGPGLISALLFRQIVGRLGQIPFLGGSAGRACRRTLWLLAMKVNDGLALFHESGIPRSVLVSIEILLRLLGIDGAPLSRPVGHNVDGNPDAQSLVPRSSLLGRTSLRSHRRRCPASGGPLGPTPGAKSGRGRLRTRLWDNACRDLGIHTDVVQRTSQDGHRDSSSLSAVRALVLRICKSHISGRICRSAGPFL